MENARFLKIVIIILLVINIVTLGFLWINHGRNEPPFHPGREDAGSFLSHELMFSTEQEKQFGQLREEHHHAAEQIQEEGRELHHRFFELLHGPSADSATVQAAAGAITDNQKKMELITFYHFQKVRAICNPEQQKKFDDVIDEALRMMASKPPGRDRR